jgi:hypothetical protein
MKRQDAVSLLKEITSKCESFQEVKSVSINHDTTSGNWELHVSWMPHPMDIECLKKIVASHSAEIQSSGEKTVFR